MSFNMIVYFHFMQKCHISFKDTLRDLQTVWQKEDIITTHMLYIVSHILKWMLKTKLFLEEKSVKQLG